MVDAPYFCGVGEQKSTGIPECIVWNLDHRERIYHGERSFYFGSTLSAVVNNVIQIRHIAGQSIGDDDITKPIIVEISDEWSPAPICFENPCHVTHITKHRMSVRRHSGTQLKHIPYILVLITKPA